MIRNLVLQCTIFVCIFWLISSFKSYDMLNEKALLSDMPLELETISGSPVKLMVNKKSNTANRKMTIYYFFAPWCQICHASIGNLQTLYRQNNRVNIVAIALDYVDKQQVSDFSEKHNLSMPIALGNEHVKQVFKIKGYPSYYVLDEDNTVKYSSVGYSSEMGLYFRTL